MILHICDFSTEVLLHIFQYCDVYDLCRLRRSCKRFNRIILQHRNINENKILVTNQKKYPIRYRSLILLDPFEKWRISHNWKTGRYKTITLLKQDKKFMPWLVLDNTFLWLSQGIHIKAYKRTSNRGVAVRVPHYILSDGNQNDIVKFSCKDNYIISGQRNGGVWLWSKKEERLIINIPQCHESDITCVDVLNDIFITGSHDKLFKIWPLQLDTKDLEPLYVKNLSDRIWSLGICPTRKSLAIGSAGCNNIPPFHIFDLERCQPVISRGHTFIKGSGILDLHWENDKTILTCGYDGYLRKWDIRTGECEQKWEDPHDSALYCLASDDLYTVVTGANLFGRVVLWDQRLRNYIQMYYTCNNSNLNRSSPVYSISFDGCQLFTALDSYVKCLDFSSLKCREIKNYSNIF
ncbi:uncharacterized protein CBL_12082 [Carabus blaptoides fortunei]